VGVGRTTSLLLAATRATTTATRSLPGNHCSPAEHLLLDLQAPRALLASLCMSCVLLGARRYFPRTCAGVAFYTTTHRQMPAVGHHDRFVSLAPLRIPGMQERGTSSPVMHEMKSRIR